MIVLISVTVALLSVIGTLYLSQKVRGWVSVYDSAPCSFSDIPPLHGKIAIVTGINTGIGLVTARELLIKGARVIGTVRSETKRAETYKHFEATNPELKANLDIELMDLSSLHSVRNLAKEVITTTKSIDIVILNAGVMYPKYVETKDGFENNIGVNHLGNFLLAKLLGPVLNTKGCRIVTVASIAHMWTYPGGINFDLFQSNSTFSAIHAYGQSKLANILFAKELSRVYKDTKITSNSLHPGSIVTDLGRNLQTPLDWLTRPLFKTLSRSVLMDTDTGAITQLYVATSPSLEGVTGEYFEPMCRRGKTSKDANNASLRRTLWDYSVKAVKAFSEPLLVRKPVGPAVKKPVA